MSHRSVYLLAILVAAGSACRPKPAPPTPQGTSRIELSEDGYVNVTAAGTPVSRLLDQLRTSYGVVVKIPEFQDRVVTDRFIGVTLDSAVRRLVPGSRPFIVVTGPDRNLPAETGTKVGRKTPRPTGLPRKDTVAVVPLNDSLRAKPTPDTTRSATPARGTLLKAAPSDTAQPGPSGPKKPLAIRPDSVRHLWASLVITATGRLSVEAANVLEGPHVVSPVPEGTYYYIVAGAGRPVAIGSFADPFERRAYAPDPRGPHQIARADTGRFVVTAPWEPLANIDPDSITIQVLRLRPGAPPPPVELQRVAELTRQLEPVATLSPGALRDALGRARPPR